MDSNNDGGLCSKLARDVRVHQRIRRVAAEIGDLAVGTGALLESRGCGAKGTEDARRGDELAEEFHVDIKGCCGLLMLILLYNGCWSELNDHDAEGNGRLYG